MSAIPESRVGISQIKKWSLKNSSHWAHIILESVTHRTQTFISKVLKEHLGTWWAQLNEDVPCRVVCVPSHCSDSATEPCLVVVPAIRSPNIKHIGGLLSPASSVWVHLCPPHNKPLEYSHLTNEEVEAHWFQVSAQDYQQMASELGPRSVCPPSPCLVPVLGGLLRAVMEQCWAAHLYLVFHKMLPPPRTGNQP